MIVTLTDEEKRRFADWLRQEWETSRGIIEQLEKIGVPKAMIDRTKAEAVGCKLVAQKLTDTESVTIEG